MITISHHTLVGGICSLGKRRQQLDFHQTSFHSTLLVLLMHFQRPHIPGTPKENKTISLAIETFMTKTNFKKKNSSCKGASKENIIIRLLVTKDKIQI